jgi:hypothetical protein
MGCGGNSQTSTGSNIITVYGDLYSSDTRTVLTLMSMLELQHEFKAQTRSKDMIKNLGSHYDQFTLDYISKIVPVLEEGGYKRIGSLTHIIEYICVRDQRNLPKLDENGKLIRMPKGWKPAKEMNPVELRKQLNRMNTWFLTKFKPFSNHLFC